MDHQKLTRQFHLRLTLLREMKYQCMQHQRNMLSGSNSGGNITSQWVNPMQWPTLLRDLLGFDATLYDQIRTDISAIEEPA